MSDRDTLRVQFRSDTGTIEFFVGLDEEPIGTWNMTNEAGDPAELERRLGYLLLSLLSTIAGRSVGIRDYLADRNSRSELVLESLRKRLANGDGSAIVSMVLELVGSARRNRDLRYLERADQLLRNAAEAGNSSAIDYLSTHWPVERSDAVAAIQDCKAK